MFELYDFSELRLFIENRLGIDTSRAKSNFIPIKKVFKTTRELDKSVEINPEGIFYTDEKGKRHKGFLFIAGGYKLDVAIARGWQTIVPKFHILNCSTIMQQKARANFNGHYVFSQKIEKVEDLIVILKKMPRKYKLNVNVANAYDSFIYNVYIDDYAKKHGRNEVTIRV